MKRSKSGAQKRKEAATARDAASALPNGESVSRSWLVYSGESDQVFAFVVSYLEKH